MWKSEPHYASVLPKNLVRGGGNELMQGIHGIRTMASADRQLGQSRESRRSRSVKKVNRTVTASRFTGYGTREFLFSAEVGP